MIERLLLPPDNEDHMPPKRRPQLTKEEIKLLHWWVSNQQLRANDFKITAHPQAVDVTSNFKTDNNKKKQTLKTCQ